MSVTPIPPEVEQAIGRLRREASEKARIADELERHYTGQAGGLATAFRRAQQVSDTSGYFGQGEVGPSIPVGQAPVPTAEDIKRQLAGRSSRVSVLASYFSVPEQTIREIILAPGSGLHIPDWRGWVKLTKHK